MSNRFLISNTLIFIQDQFAEQLFKKSGKVTIKGETALIIKTNNCDHYSQIGINGSNESFLFDLNGMFYVVPESWAKQKMSKIVPKAECNDYTFITAENITDLMLTATSEERPLEQGG